jgi:transcriptional regulator with XRE-family HTH domain
MITGMQIRAARAALRWSVKELASIAGVGTQTIKRFEVVEGIPQSRTQTLLEVKAAFEAAGIEFIGTPEDNPGIRLVSPKSLEKTRLSGARG